MLRLADGLALYGTGSAARTAMTQGAWAQVDSPITVETSNPRGQGTHHLRFPITTQGDIVRRVIGADIGDGVGFGAGFYFSELPDDDTSHVLFQARDGANAVQFSVMLTTVGKIRVRLGTHTGTEVAITDDPVITAGAYKHIELFAVCGGAGGSPGGGSIEIRVNGITVLNEADVALQNQVTNSVEQFVIGSPATGPVWAGIMDVADVHVFDSTGVVNSDFMGDTQWLPVYATADVVAAQEWTPSGTGSAYTFVDDSTGPDDDTTYIEGPYGSPGAVSEFEITNCPALTSEIKAFVFQPMLRKTDAGDGSAQMALVQPTSSPDDVANGVDTALTQVYTYYPEVFETDPATGVAWTPSGFNSARVRLTRTA